MEKKACPHCGSSNIEESVSIGQSAEIGNIGPKYKKGWMMGVAQLYGDLCKNCGTITRFFIKERTDLNWDKKPGSIGSK